MTQETTTQESSAVLNITDAAAKKVHELISEEGNDQLRLRVYIVGGGCAGFQYGFAFETNVNADDMLVQKDGVGVVVDAMSLQYLAGSTVDYVNDLKGAHFVVINPNANTTCGCGSSFSV